MNAKKTNEKASGFTLIEILISLGIFGILLSVLYPTFDSVGDKVNELGDKQALTQKGQRVMDYVSEEFRLAGLFVGSSPSVTFCSESRATDSVMHEDGKPGDSDPLKQNDIVTILTSERIMTTKDDAPFLFADLKAEMNESSIFVNVEKDYVSAITPASGLAGNAKAYITFDTLKPNTGRLVYQVTNFSALQISVSPALAQTVNKGSNAYLVVRKKFAIGDSRNLQVQRWTPYPADSPTECKSDNQDLVSSHGTGTTVNGGVDGFEVEYTVWDAVQKKVWNPYTSKEEPRDILKSNPANPNTDADLANIRAITFWVLLRADFPSKNYKNDTVYTLGTLGKVTKGPFNDNYRRLLMTRTVEVKNVRL